MRKISLIIFAFLALIGSLSAEIVSTIGQTEYPELSASTYESLHDRMKQALLDQEDYIIEVLNNAQDAIFPAEHRLRIRQAKIDLEVKRILVTDFQYADELRSRKMQEHLFQVLESRGISETDLIELKNTVAEERAKISAWEAAQAAPEPEPIPEPSST